VPRRFGKDRQFADILQDAGSCAVQADDVGGTGAVQIHLDISLRGDLPSQLMEQSSFELTGLDFKFGARGPINDLDLDAGLTNAIAQLRSQIPLQFLAAKLLNAWQQWPNRQLRASIGKQYSFLFHLIFWI